MNIPQPDLVKATLDLAAASGAVSNFCDHAEHNEAAEIRDVQAAARTLRETSVALSLLAGHDPIDLYAERLGAIEARNVLHFEGALDSAASAREVTDLRSLQLIQAAHDHAYHADVVGLTKSDQLRHYALHVAKLAGSTADLVHGRVGEQDWLARRVPDMLLFGIKLSTVTSERLAATPACELSGRPAPLRSAA
jgi:hypothetical protein